MWVFKGRLNNRCYFKQLLWLKKHILEKRNGKRNTGLQEEASVLFNRHSILNEFDDKTFSYSIENYIKFYNSIHFLVWAFLIFEKQSMLNQISDDDFKKKSFSQKKYFVQNCLSKQN